MAVERRRDERARIFTIGAAYGFVAGVFAVTLIVWQFGDVMATRAAPGLAAVPAAEIAARDADAEPSPVIETPPPAATTGSSADAPTIAPPPSSELKDRDLLLPVEGVRPEQLTRQFDDPRGSQRRHEAIDILAPRGTPVKAVEDGRIARLFQSRAGGITIYQFDPSQTFCYYYAHLDRYATGLREGDPVSRGQVIGYVGTTGNAPANTPHLHFAIFRLTAEKRWWEGTPIDPFDVLR
jgi:murein DD-endopeptidase MepM/ murein hydrolase activator NlpD